MTWQDWLPVAATIVEAERRLWPGCEHARCAGGGGSSGAFSRTGTGVHERAYNVPSDVSSLIMQNANTSGLDPALGAKQNVQYGRLMDDTPEAQPGFGSLLNASNINATDYEGRDSLANIAGQNPFSGDFENDTMGAYRQRAAQAMGEAATGPDAVRGGQAQTGIMQGVLADQLARGRGQEVRQARMQDASMVGDASKSMAGIEQARTQTGVNAATGLSNLASGVASRGLGAAAGVDNTKQINLQMLQLVSSLMGKTMDTQTDNFSGKGDQSGWQGGVSCCFIFNEALNGELPWHMELARCEFWNPRREVGYRWMAGWLVPAMQQRRWVRSVVNVVLIKPFLRYSAWVYGEANGIASALLAPYCYGWLALWATLGRRD